ncbi:HypC/HybG/HupF family hydrogenase formation chaperone [Thiohalobacter sp. IOR34]|uniref:HypC/HybG/HupF family hydrogenase formation chaperone n=1 Tax=Thiohalobacter sp. IOR34 TaxID=3057176 RepID=UPI0025AF618B|nr:HypC/HybG/HupF family hydrogenase formation chaperone [Thiohalobacter sp. IOR34]WJW76391.1 HypC/HybG/HupF family hydrogenase formation chaperone [Thiohalobacter sp. IOR34]
MCLALPARVVAIETETDSATVALGAVRKTISLALLDDIRPGDYVLLHVGYAIARISEAEAQRTLALFAEAGLGEGEPG